MPRIILTTICAAALAVCAFAAEESAPIAEQPVPFSVWLDFNSLAKANAPLPALPIWFQSLQSEAVPANGDTPPKTLFRLRLRRLPDLHHEMLFRVFFDDLPDMQPVISAWSEAGKERFRTTLPGSGTGLPTHESIILPVEGTDYVDIEVPGDGSSIRGAFASSLKDAPTRQTTDFAPTPELTDPFGNITSAPAEDSDSKLFGRIKAVLDPGVVSLSLKAKTAETWEFDLAAQPLIAVVSFDVLNADTGAAPVVTVNEGDPAFASIHWPDLADPAYRGESRSLEQGMRFQYTGWLHAQAIISGKVLRSGLNKITIGLSEGSSSIAVRNVELQLKHNWKHFDYILSPTNP